MQRIRAGLVALAIAALSAAPIRAQQADASQTHTVKKGDTLWDLAKQYLGDSYLWPEIYRLNTDKIEDPHWIYPGEMLKLPGAKGMIAKGPATNASAADANVSAVSNSPRQGNGKRMTVFNPNANKTETRARESLNLRVRGAAVRPGEYIVSPFAWSVGGPKDGGLLEESAEGTGIAMTANLRPIQYREPVFVHLPRGAPGNTGDQFIVYRLGRVIVGQGQAVVPTGVIRLTQHATNGRARAELTQKFEDVFTGQGVTPMDTFNLRQGVFPRRVEFGLSTRVSWIGYDPVLPNAGQYLILAAGSKEGLMPGDQVTLLRQRGEDLKGLELPDEEVAVAQLTRVTEWGAAAIIVKTMQPGVAEGIRARITAKMP